MPQQRRVYAAWFEGLFVRALGSRITPVLLDELRAAGLDLEKPLVAAYPADVRRTCLRLLREHLFPSLSDDAAYFAIGRVTVDGFLQTLVGQSIAVVVRFLGPRAMFKRVNVFLTSSSNYMTGEAEEQAPFRWHITVHHADLPASYFLGLARSMLDLFQLPNPHVEILQQTDEQLVVGLEWSPGDAVSTR